MTNDTDAVTAPGQGQSAGASPGREVARSHLQPSNGHPAWAPWCSDAAASEPRPSSLPEPEPGALRLSIIGHANAETKHPRLRLSLSGALTRVLGRALKVPRIHVQGDAAHGLSIFCTDAGGLAPTVSRHTGAWAVTLPARRVGARNVPTNGTHDVAYEWVMDPTGPALVVPRLPDVFLPEGTVALLPNSQVDHETRMERAEPPELPADAAGLDDGPCLDATPAEEPPADDASGSAASDATGCAGSDVGELRAAIQLVNELKDRLGDGVVLVVDDAGRLQARRRVVSYVEV